MYLLQAKMLRRVGILSLTVVCLFGFSLITPLKAEDAKTEPVKPAEAKKEAPQAAEKQEALVFQKGVGRVNDQGIIIPGAVENHTNKWLSLIVRVKLFDKSGKELTGKDGETALITYLVAPGSVGAFQYNSALPQGQAEYDHYELAIAEAKEVEGTMIGEISEVKTTNRAGGEMIQVTGVFKSTGPNACNVPMTVAVGYTTDGLIYEVGESTLQDASGNPIESVKSGESAKFELLLENADGKVQDVKVFGGCGS